MRGCGEILSNQKVAKEGELFLQERDEPREEKAHPPCTRGKKPKRGE